jgi:RNA polymerase sigma-70 factor (ECF subfamily)
MTDDFAIFFTPIKRIFEPVPAAARRDIFPVVGAAMSSVPHHLVAPVQTDTEGDRGSAAEGARYLVATLYAEHGGEFLTYAQALGRNEELARDAIQEAFMRYFIALCEGTEVPAPRPWIYRVMHNYLVDRMREKRLESGDALRNVPAYGSDVERECLRREVFGLVRTALSPREFDCFRLRTEGLDYEEIASRLELKSGTVGALISRAMRKLRTLGRSMGGRP